MKVLYNYIGTYAFLNPVINIFVATIASSPIIESEENEHKASCLGCINYYKIGFGALKKLIYADIYKENSRISIFDKVGLPGVNK